MTRTRAARQYTGTARMGGDRETCGAERIELYLDESGHELSRLEAYDNVRFQLKTREHRPARQRRAPHLLRRGRSLRR